MKKTFTLFYSISISVIFLAALSYFGINIYKNYSPQKAEQRIKNLELSIKNIPETCSPGTNEFDKNLQKLIQPLEDFSYLEIKCNGKTIIKYPKDSTDNVEETSKLIYKNNVTSINFYGDIILIKANTYILKPSQILQYTKNTFFIILFATILTIIISIIFSSTPEGNSDLSDNDDSQDSFGYKEESSDDNVDYEEAVVRENNFPIPPEDSYVEETYVEEMEPDYDETAVLPSEEIKPMELDENPKGPEGLFSPLTGFGWESYLLTRLNNELNRATASELDLALFQIKFTNLSRENELTKKICEILTSYFQFKDLIFEYKDDSYVALKIDMNIDQALQTAEKMYSELTSVIGDFECNIGITSRTIRMITGERLLKEADEAVNHIIDDKETNIIAFRADAAKYREFIDKN